METEKKEKKDNLLAVSIIIAAFVIGGSFIYSSGSRPERVSADRPGTEAPRSNNVTADDDVILGDREAPVTLIAFGDYQCPFCGASAGTNTETMAHLISQNPKWAPAEPGVRDAYIATGKVKMVYRDFPLDGIHPYARPAAEAAECARDQGKYWLYHDALFERQDEIPAMNFISLAAELGLDTAPFKACVDERKYKDEVESDYQDGVAAGVTGTPGYFVLGKDGKVVQFIEGAQPYEVMRAAIEKALNA